MDPDSNKVRLGALGIVALSLFLALFARLWYLQGIEREQFEAASVSNRLRVIQTEGPRGRILDRNGRVIVDNRTAVVVSLDREPLRERIGGLDERDPDDVEEMRERLEEDFVRIAEALTSLGVPTTPDDVWARFSDKRYSPQQPVPVVEDVDVEVENYLLERAAEFPGVVVERRAIREYPYGPVAAHVLGYVGQINEQELLDRGVTVSGVDEEPAPTTTVPGREPKPYEPGNSIGKSGVERAYEDDLRAVPGERTIEVNARGEMVDVVADTPPVPGDDVWLSIDIDLQAHAEHLLAERIESIRGGRTRDGSEINAPQGSVVVQDPGTGELLAMVSYPAYDPTQIVNGIPTALWEQFQDPESGLPLNNWAMQGTYAPGSTFKPFTVLAGMRTGFIRPGNESYVDNGVYRLRQCAGAKCEFQNAGRARYGSVDVSRSLTVSSDVYYYWIAESLWVNREGYGEHPIQDTALEFGLGERSGIELAGENRGRMPTPTNRREAFEANPEAFLTGDWFTGDNIITSIGQGDVLVTPLQLVGAYSALANGGSLMRPHVVRQVTRVVDPTAAPGEDGNFEVVRTIEPEVRRSIEMTPEQYTKIVDGLIGVTQRGEGTASAAWNETPTAWPFAGKTGTAEVNRRADTALFAGWGPAVPGATPRFAAAVVIPEAGFGGDVAAPLTFRILAPASEGTLPEACPVRGAAAAACEERNEERRQLAELAEDPAYAATYGSAD